MYTVREGAEPIRLAVHEQGEGPAVVFSHGFPELAYSWRHQLPAVSAAGFRAIAPDQRGYGGSSRPAAIEDYSLTVLAGDLVGLLDALETEQAIFVGHDWGVQVVWSMPLLHPDRTLGVASICTPYEAFPSTDIMRALTGGDAECFYMLWFQEPGVAEAVMDSRVPELMQLLLRRSKDPAALFAEREAQGGFSLNPFLREADVSSAMGEMLVSPEELDDYVDAFERTGFRGAINWYRNVDRNLEDVPELGTTKLDLPCLRLTAEWDFAIRPEFAAGMPALIEDLEIEMIPRSGHWVQQESPDLVNRHLVGWLTDRFGP